MSKDYVALEREREREREQTRVYGCTWVGEEGCCLVQCILT